MPTHRAIKALINNFLGTYVSRYTDHRGFWIFGLWVNEHEFQSIDLLSPAAEGDSVSASAENLAKARFSEQSTKFGFSHDDFSAVSVSITRSSELVHGHAGNRPVLGYRLTLTVRVISASGREHSASCESFAEPRAFAKGWL